jgi:dynein heavy chain
MKDILKNGVLHDAGNHKLFSKDIVERLRRFLDKDEENTLFLWIDEEKGKQVLLARDQLANLVDNGTVAIDFNYFIKYKPLKGVHLTEENIEEYVTYGSISLDDNMKSLLYEISVNTLPKFLKDKEWPENIKKDLLEQIHKFMAILTETVAQRQGNTKLYVPKDYMDDKELNPNDKKDRNHRLKEVLSHWTKQIRELINNQTNQSDSDNSGPLEEIDNWTLRRDNLNNIKEQLENPAVVEILRILKEADNKNVKNFNELVRNITGGAEEAEENLKYLQTLYEPCKEMSTAAPAGITAILPKVMHCVRLIRDYSKYYNTEDKISGLLRKISNEVINRCKKCINLDDMLTGDVHKCVKQLKEAINCCKQWREIYNEYVGAINLDERPGDKSREWKIKSDSIFAQIEAFVQRCNDLIEICDGQIQFARKNRAVDLPKFSGSKGPEIVAVLDEIKSSFGKYLERIEGTDKEKILDINSTKWHDDYSIFKAGTKNLEIMYINLINFAFDHINKLSQAIEYMEAFDDLAQKASIKSHVHKQFSKINDIFKKELQLADLSSKKPFWLPFNHGKESGEAIWVRSLLYRIERLKALYESLTFIPIDKTDRTEIKRPIIEEYDRVEKNLTTTMKNLNSHFDLYLKGLDENLANIEGKSLFVDSDSLLPAQVRFSDPKDSKTKPVMIEAKASGKGHIESNFNKELLRILIETTAFKKLIKDNIGYFGQKVEEYVVGKREMLRVVREVVMISVRDYNMVHDLMDAKEKQLFAQHLESWDEPKMKGINKKVQWSPIVDTNCREMKDQYHTVYHIMMQFKYNKAIIQQKINEISNIKFIDFETKDPQEVQQFVDKQNVRRKTNETILGNIFKDIKKIMSDNFEDFIRQDRRIHLAWFEFVRSIDKRIEDELRKSVRTSFQEFFKAIAGDIKHQINPIHLFKVYIILRTSTNDEGFKLVFDPLEQDLITRITSVLFNSVEVLNKKRVETDLLEIRSRRVQELIDKKAIDDKIGNKVEEIRTVADNGFLIEARTEPASFKDVASKDVTNIMAEINQALAKQTKSMISFLDPWQNEKYRKIWGKAKKEYLKESLKTMRVTDYRDQLDQLELTQGSIKTEQASSDSICIYIDSSKIRQDLMNFCAETQKTLLGEFKSNAIAKLNSIYNEFSKVTKELDHEPEALESLKESDDKLAEFEKRINTIGTEISNLEEIFKLLDDYMEYLSADDNKRRLSLPEAAEKFKQNIEKMGQRNREKFLQLKRNFLEQLKQLMDEIKENKSTFDKTAPFNVEEGDVEGALKKIDNFKAETIKFRNRLADMKFGFDLFKEPEVAVPDLVNVEKEIENLKLIWFKKKEWKDAWNILKEIQFSKINTEDVKMECTRFLEDIKAFDKHIQAWGVSKDLVSEIQLVIDNMPIIDTLRQPYMRERHWISTKSLVNKQFDHTQEFFTLERFIELAFTSVLDKIYETSENAQAQYRVEILLTKIKQDWSKLNIDLNPMPNSPDIYVVKRDSIGAISSRLEEDMVTLATLKTNISAIEFESEIEQWDFDLNKVMESLETLSTVQRKFENVNNIFNNIQSELAQLAGDVANFNTIRNDFKIQMERIQQNSNAKEALTFDQFKTKFDGMEKELDKIQNALKDLLKQRRSKFARFYFLSDEDMFELLGKAKNPVFINKHLKKMYEGIKSLKADEGKAERNTKTYKFVSMDSPDKETIQFVDPVDVTGNLIKMMEDIEKQMKESLKDRLKAAFVSLSSINNPKQQFNAFENFIKEIPGQIILLCIQIEWTKKCQETISAIHNDLERVDKGDKENKELGKKKTGNPIRERWKEMVDRYAAYVSETPKMMLSEISAVVKLKINALIIVLVHNRDIISDLEKSGCTNLENFEWKKQLRFEKVNDEGSLEHMRVKITQADAEFSHGWEYQGNNGRLIITGLTDRCYLTLTTAMNLNKGGCPQGPAGTGKTETVKDLGKNMGRFVFVFNCSEGLDVKSLKSMFEGFALTGSWGCFDEFNRIEIEVLSVVAIYIKNILDSLAQIDADKELGSVNLDDEKISLNRNCSIFITMNPGYSGRTELPDNLKALFRPISMMVPEAEKICHISLMSEGFQYAEGLAKKINTLYDLMKQQLSKQGHYDFGLRAIKSVLDLSGKIKRGASVKQPKQGKNKAAESLGAMAIDEEETIMMIKAIRDMNDPKLVADDIPLFMALLKDLFPSQKIDSKKDKDLSMKIHKVLIEQHLDNTDYCVNKIIQLYDSKQTRHGNMLVGRTNSGKSTVYKVLQKALNLLNAELPTKFSKVNTYALNPKSISMTELYGYFDSTEDKSHIGVFSYLMDFLCNQNETSDQKWIVFDGPIDTKWIESMNSLLDDNKILTLLDGNRINLHPLVSLIFETEDLTQASPATVSRCGMVYMDIDRLEWDSLRLRWLLQKEMSGYDEESLDTIEDLFDKWVTPIFNAKARGILKDVVPCHENHLVSTLLRLLDAFIIKENNVNFETKSTDEMFWIKYEKWFTYCVIWSIGAAIHEDYRKEFDKLIRGIEDVFPLSQTVYDCYINLEKNEFVKWEDRLTIPASSWKPKEPNTPKHRLLVETVDTIRSRFMIDCDLKNHLPLLVIGVTGTGKTAILNSYLGELSDNEYSYNIINLSAQTTSMKLQQIVESKLNTTSKRKYRPHNGKKGVIFIDDLNMPKKDDFGSQPPLELLRQFLEFGGWYDRANLDIFVEIKDTDIIGSMGPPGGGRNQISNRLASKFHIVNFPIPNSSQIKRIYTSILNYATQGFDSEEIRIHIEKVVDIIIENFGLMCSKLEFKPTPAKSHYLFNLRDMSRVVQGISMVKKDSCDTTKTLLKLLVHEHLRVYRDRMINKEDRSLFRKQLDQLLAVNFSTNLMAVLDEPNEDYDFTDELIFVDFLDAGRAYSEVKSIEQLRDRVEQKRIEFNNRTKIPIDIVLFNDALKNLCRINRILCMSNGHALLIGEGGSGRHSLSRMATYLAEYMEFQIKIAKNYSTKHFQADMQGLFFKIIDKNQPYTFIFSDNEIATEGIIEDVNNILSLGEIPNLYQKKDGKDDFQPIRDKLRPRDKNKAKETDEKIYDNFLSKIQQKLHISFCMSQSGNTLRTLARKYPGLINNTTQIWFDDWPLKALEQVAIQNLYNLKGEDEIKAELPPPKAEGEEEQSEEEEEPAEGSEDDGERQKRIEQKKKEKEDAIREELKRVKIDAMSKFFSNVHTSVKNMGIKMFEETRRQIFVTPKNFIDFMREYTLVARKKREEIMKQLTTYSIGLEKLAEAQRNAGIIREKINIANDNQKKNRKKLDHAQKESTAAERLLKIENDNLAIKSEEIAKQEVVTNQLEYDCNEQLKKVQPILDEANERVKELENKRQDFAEVKALATKKHATVMIVMRSIMILMGERPDDDSILKCLANDFVRNLIKVDREMLANDRQRFDKFEELVKAIPTDLSKVSVAVETLRKYVSAIGSYIKALKGVMPVREKILKLKQTLENLKRQREEMEYKRDQAEAKEKEQKEKRRQLDSDIKRLEEELEILGQKHERAEDLVKGLENSKGSWTKSKEDLEKSKRMVEGNVMLSVGFMNYFGPFPTEYREVLKDICVEEVKISKIEFDPLWDFVNYLGDPVEVLDWTFKGLPSDQFSKENGIIVRNTVRWPLMIDPQNQASTWIKNLLVPGVDKIIDKMNPKLVDILKDAVMKGQVVLLENLDEEIDPAIEPVLAKQIKEINGKDVMAWGDDIYYNKNFRLFMTTKLSNPTYKAEISTKVTLVNFTVKEKGLQEQLLEELIKIMNKKLEDTRVEAIQQKSKCEKALKDQEATILRMLQESKTDMVDDIDLINTLKMAREEEERMNILVATSNTNLEKNRLARENYRPLGLVGSILYFTIYNLNKIDHMYQFSLDNYLELFRRVVTEKNSDKSFGGGSEVIKEKIEGIDIALRKAVYDYACRGIFEKDKLLLSLQMCVNLAEYDEKNKKEQKADEDKNPRGRKGKKRKEEEVEGEDGENKEAQREVDYFKELFPAEWNFFLKGGIVLNSDNQLMNPDRDWISDNMWNNITELDSLPNFQGIAGSFTHTNKDWKRYFTSEQPETEPLPSDWGTKIKGFSLLVLLRAIRIDRVPFAAMNFVKVALGDMFINPPAFNINDIYKSLSKNIPCLFILSPGADPLTYLENLASEKKITINQVSLGQKQTARAKDKIKIGRTTGEWVFLANVHLSIEFLKDLEAIIEEIRLNKIDLPKGTKNSEKLNENFRLFMTAVPTKNFPISILQRCMKVTTEPPKGIKANMLKLYSNLVRDIWTQADVPKPRFYGQLLYALTWFHSLVIERKKFRTLGWNVMYDFNDSDFVFSDNLIRSICRINMPRGSNQSVQWDAIKYIIAEVNYGGRVTDDYDRRLLKQYASELFVEDLFNSEKPFVLSHYKLDTEYKLPKETIDDSGIRLLHTGKDGESPPQELNIKIICSEFIDNAYPAVEVPAVFGSHGNAEVTSQKMEATILLDSLLMLQPRDQGGSDKSREEVIIGKIDGYLKIVPEEINYIDARAKNPPIDEEPLRNVLLQEVSRYNTVIQVVKSTFVELVAGLKGQTLISEEMELVLQNIEDNKVPARWKFAYLSIKPLISWLNDLNLRVDRMRTWAFKGTPGSVNAPFVFWLGGFTYPTGFTTALKQKSARGGKDKTAKIPIDAYKWEFMFLKTDVQQPPREGAYINGAYIEGARWSINDEL